MFDPATGQPLHPLWLGLMGTLTTSGVAQAIVGTGKRRAAYPGPVPTRGAPLAGRRREDGDLDVHVDGGKSPQMLRRYGASAAREREGRGRSDGLYRRSQIDRQRTQGTHAGAVLSRSMRVCFSSLSSKETRTHETRHWNSPPISLSVNCSMGRTGVVDLNPRFHAQTTWRLIFIRARMCPVYLFIGRGCP